MSGRGDQDAMKTVSIRLEDSVYEALGGLLDSMGQTKQTFYETYTKTALREGCIPFIIRASAPEKKNVSKMQAFERLEAVRKRNAGNVDYDVERGEAMNEKYGSID